MTDKGLDSNIYKQFMTLISIKTNNPINKCTKDLNRETGNIFIEQHQRGRDARESKGERSPSLSASSFQAQVSTTSISSPKSLRLGPSGGGEMGWVGGSRAHFLLSFP